VKLLLIRHAQSLANLAWQAGLPTDDEDMTLSALGFIQAGALAQAFADELLPTPQHLYSSLMQRAVKTAAPIASALNIPVTGLADVYEVGGVSRVGTNGRAAYPGLGSSQLQALCPQLILPSSVTAEGWYFRDIEPRTDSWDRAKEAMSDLFDRHRNTDDLVAVVSHGMFIQLLMRVVMGWEPDLTTPRLVTWFEHSNTATTMLTSPGLHDTENWVHWVNRIDHLRPDQVSS
jgi:2,3-bisphosphoglycerate-dependent phosphoglycerate mutase